MLSGCAGLSNIGKSPEEIVALRAKARWDAIVAGEWETAYGYSTPAFRKAIKLTGFMNIARSMVVRKGAEVQTVTCSDATCDVVVKVLFSPPLQGRGGGVLDTEVPERWVKEDGNWYIYQRF